MHKSVLYKQGEAVPFHVEVSDSEPLLEGAFQMWRSKRGLSLTGC